MLHRGAARSTHGTRPWCEPKRGSAWAGTHRAGSWRGSGTWARRSSRYWLRAAGIGEDVIGGLRSLAAEDGERRNFHRSVRTPPAARGHAGHVIRRYELSRAQFVLLEALVRGESVGEAIGRAAGQAGEDDDRFAADLGAWFRDWTAEGFFVAVNV